MDNATKPDGPAPDTSTTLLGALASTGAPPEAWTRFARIYDPVARVYLAILRRSWPALNPAWDDDVVQEAFLALVRLLPDRKWDPAKGRFRDFLFGVVRNKALALAARERRAERAPEALAAAEPVLRPGTAETEREALRRELWRALVDRVFAAGRMSETSKTVFLRLVEENAPVAALSRAYGMTPNAIYRLKNRTTAKIREAWLSAAGPDGDLADALESLAREMLAAPPSPAGRD